jgi:uncharacterized protein
MDRVRAVHALFIALWLPAGACAPRTYGEYPAGQSAELDEQSCERKDGAACLRLGNAAVEDADESSMLFARSCELGHLKGCTALAIHWRGHGDPVAERRAFNLLVTTCGRGEADACTFVGHAYTRYGEHVVPVDEAKALVNFDRGCSLGSDSGCFCAALSYQRGEGVPRDVGTAIERYRRACELGHGDSCLALSSIYEHGDGVAKDEKEAKRYWDRGCQVIGGAPPCVIF